MRGQHLLCISWCLLTAGISFNAAAHDSAAECVDGNAGGYECQNIDLVSHMSLAELGGEMSGYEAGNDIWGWKDPDTGKEYAIVGLYTGTAFVDISDPEHPVLVAKLTGTPHTPKTKPAAKACHDGCGGSGEGEAHDIPGEETESTWMDIKVYKNVAYVGSEEFGYGVRVFDLKRLRTLSGGVEVSADRVLTEVMNSHNLAVDQDNGFLYAVGDTNTVGSSYSWGGAHIYDLSAPLNPVYKGEIVIDAALAGESYLHDLWCGTYEGPDADYQGRQICFGANSGSERDTTTGKTKYYCAADDAYYGDWTFDDKGTAASGDDELQFAASGCVQTRAQGFYSKRYSYLAALDVTDKSAIKLIDRVTFDDSRYIHQQWPTPDHKYLYVNDELEEYAHGRRTTFYIYDLDDLDALEMVSTFEYPTLDIDHNLYIKDRFAYQSNYGAGLRMLDVSDPVKPYEIGYFDIRPNYSDYFFLGTWSNYTFDSGIVAISDMQEGLYLLKPDLADNKLKPDLAVNADVFYNNEDGNEYAGVYVYNNGPAAAEGVEIRIASSRKWDDDFAWFLVDEFESAVTTSLTDGVTCEVISQLAGTDGWSYGTGFQQVSCRIDSLGSCSGMHIGVGMETFEVGSLLVSASSGQLEGESRTSDNTVRVGLSAMATVDGLPDFNAKRDAMRSAACDAVPEVSAGQDTSGESGASIQLAGSVDGGTAELGSVKWTQVSGPAASFADASDPATKVTLPSVNAETSITLRLTAATEYGHEDSDEMTITVTAKGGGGGGGGDGGGNGGGALFYLLPGILLFARRKRVR